MTPVKPTARTRGLCAVASLVLVPVLAGATLAGCGGADERADAGSADSAGAAGRESGSGNGSAAKQEPGNPEGLQDGTDNAQSGGATARSGDRTSARVLPGDRDIVYRGQITVRVKDVGRAAARAESVALGVDGVVFSEQTSVDPDRRGIGEATLALRVPPTQFAATLDSLGRLGRELSRTRSAQDVTTELADTDSRVRSQERSVARVRSLLAEADTIGEVVQVESELARREADLESLQAQLARLKDVTDLATIDVTFIARNTQPRPMAEGENLGFGSGLSGGWDAFVSIVLVALTVLGALVPFAVAAAILGIPAYVVLRSRRRPAVTEV